LVHSDVPAVELLAVHLFNGSVHGILVSEGDEAKPSRPPCLAVCDHLALHNITEMAEGILETGISCGPGKASNEAPEL